MADARRLRSDMAAGVGGVLAFALLLALGLPLLALVLSTSLDDLRAGMQSPLFAPALWLSARSTLTSLAVTVIAGTPLGWWLARSRSRSERVASVIVELPIVVPPAVVGVALLETFGRRGLFGDALASLGVSVPFSPIAVVIAQVVVAAPFYVRSAASAFRDVDADLLVVARTLGASRAGAFFHVAVPVALPGLLGGAALAWARSLGEFGATLLFAGSLTGRTQTMPLAIFSALESDVRVAIALSLVLAGAGALLLVALRAAGDTLQARERQTAPGALD